MTVRVAAYYRVSTQRQAKEGLSLEDQQRAVRSDCDARGEVIVEEYIERGVSGRTDERAELQRLLADANSIPRPFDAVVVHSFSRFFRDAAILELTVRGLRANGIQYRSITQPTGNDDAGSMIRQVFAIFDEYGSKENAKHVRRTMVANAKEGFWNGAAPPYGYKTIVAEVRGKKQKKKLEVDEVEAPVVRRIFDLASKGVGKSGPLGVKKIVTYLNHNGYRTRNGNFWHIGPLHQLLTRSTYKGVHQYNRSDSRTRAKRSEDEIVEVAVPPIVSVDQWSAVQEILRSKNPKVSPPQTVSGPILLTGMARCAECGSAMTIRTGKSGRYRYYSCANAQARGKAACSGLSVRMERLDEAVTSALCERVLEPSRLENLLREIGDRMQEVDSRDRGEMLRVEAELAEAKLRLDRLHEAIEKGIVDASDAQFASRIAKATTDRDVAAVAKERIVARRVSGVDITPDKVVAFGAVMRDAITAGEIPFRKTYLRLFVDEIRVGPEVALIRGRHDRLRSRVASGSPFDGGGMVPITVQEWRARRDSNP
ncbi:recombinase family protein [Methylosinus sporium]|uniref:Recombinase family protein n=1 Tax=Methylosinus sporium TaxID=428 RepID=A0A2U1SQH6_METSR|nr:recombinase family protein [Methylosinus sporium]PWB93855.1 recombinase family protein [Methylosinus sporium]